MANQASIQKHINYGYGKVAQHLGASYQWYRATSVSNPIVPANMVGTIMCHFDSQYTFAAIKPDLFNPIWAIAVDRTLLNVGDYLIGAMGTFFMFTEDPILPSSCVSCNTNINVYRPGGGQQVGNGYYGGNAQGYGDTLMLNWPASVLTGTKGEASKSGVIGDTRLQWFTIMVPDAGVLIKANDLATDAHGRRMTISAVELTSLGYRLTAQYSGT